jgi:diaminopimelate decarboxylase
LEAKRKYKAWTQALPWIKPHYAIKANPAQPLLQDLIEQGSNFDCASKTELEILLKLGVKPSDLVYSNPIKDEDDLEWAAKNQIELTTADSIDELKKIKQYAPKMKVLWRLAIKEEASDNLATPFSGKFGDDLETAEKMHERMDEIQKMGVNLSGIHFHCGSGQHGSSAFERAVNTARQCMVIGR